MSQRIHLAYIASATYAVALAAVGLSPALAAHADAVLASLAVLLGTVHATTSVGLSYRRQGSTQSAAPTTPQE